MGKKPAVEYGEYEWYWFLLFHNYFTLNLKEIFHRFESFFSNKHLLVTAIGSEKISKPTYAKLTSKGIICDLLENNLVIKPENSAKFVDYLFGKDPGGSTIYFLNRLPVKEDVEDKKIYGLPALPVTMQMFRGHKTDKKLLDILLREIGRLNANFYYDNNWFEAILVMRNEELFDNLKTFYHYKCEMKEVSF